jgi:hypothetical protein
MQAETQPGHLELSLAEPLNLLPCLAHLLLFMAETAPPPPCASVFNCH